MNILGLGKAGCNIAKLFGEYSHYNVILIDAVQEYAEKENHFFIPQRSSAELYDANPIKFDVISNEEEIVLFLCGSGRIAGSTLRILENFRGRKISVFYIYPEVELLDNKAKLRNRAHFQVLQQYARSGLFAKLYLISNKNLRNVIGKVPVASYYKKMNEYIFNIIHMLNVFNNSEPIFDTFQQDLNTCRIATISVCDIDEKIEKDLFSLKNANQIKYFFGINRLRIEEDENLIDQVTSISTLRSSTECVTSYGIYQTSYEYDLCYAVKSTAEIQIDNTEE